MCLGPTSQKSSPEATLLLPGRGGEAGNGLAPSSRTAPWRKDLEEVARLWAAEGPSPLLTWALLGCSLLEKAFLGVSWSGAHASAEPAMEGTELKISQGTKIGKRGTGEGGCQAGLGEERVVQKSLETQTAQLSASPRPQRIRVIWLMFYMLAALPWHFPPWMRVLGG